MELVFIHGWGFDAGFWDRLAPLLPGPQRHIDLGFLGHPAGDPAQLSPGRQILVGHSLGFVYGITARQDWAGWIAINSFPRFVATESLPGCVSASALRELRINFHRNPAATLARFRELIGAEPPPAGIEPTSMRQGLDVSRDCDIDATLSSIPAPGLVLASVNDPLVPVATSAALGRAARRADLRWHDTGGHNLPLTEPQWCATAIAEYLRVLDP